MKILRIIYIITALVGVAICYCDYRLHAQSPDPYIQAERTAANSALIDQIQVHDAETNRKFEEVNKRIDEQNSRMSFMEGSVAGFGGLLGMIQVGILVIPRLKSIRNYE